jgi:transposase
MPAVSAQPVRLRASVRKRLKTIARGHKSPHRDRLRAQIVLAAARGHANARIARDLRVGEDTVRKWRGRFAADGLDGLADRARSGRPCRYTPLQVAEVKALACQLPAESDTPLARWSWSELAAEARQRGIAETISTSTVGRILTGDAIKPWQHRSWISIRDPDFKAKATRVLDLYHRRWEGKKLGKNEYVISADEKPSIQARCRCHPTLAPGKARAMRVEHEYDRGGALTYLAALDVHRARVFGRCEDSGGIEPFMALVDQVMSQEPYKSAKRVFWIVDNGSSHRGEKACRRLTDKYPNAVMVHTPVHASWLNQVEIYFSIVERKVLTPNDFADLDKIRQRLAGFETRYDATAKPFKWKFTPADLDDLLARIAQHELSDPAPQKAA